MMDRKETLYSSISLFLILLACYGYFLPKWGQNDWVANSRADLVYAVADQGRLAIDDYQQNTGDKAYYRGHYYTVASIGPSLVALPFYLVFEPAAELSPVERFLNAGHAITVPSPAGGAEIRYDLNKENLALAFITFCAVSLWSALTGVLVYLFSLRFMLSSWRAFLMALAYGLGTIAFPYSKALFQHQVAAFGAFAGFFLLWRILFEGANPNGLWVAGALFSLSAISEYPQVLFLSLVLLWALYEYRRPLWDFYRMILGAFPLLAIFLSYNVAAFGNWFPVGYRYHVTNAQMHSQGLMGITHPSLQALYGITFSPYRGLFFISPFLLLSIPGFYVMNQALSRYQRLSFMIAAMTAGFLLYNASYQMWWGGYSVGPRFLVPLLPFLVIPVGFAFERGFANRRAGLLIDLLVILSIAAVWVQTIAGQYYPPSAAGEALILNPLFEYSLPLLLRGDVALNYGHFLGLTGLASLAPLLLLLALASLPAVWVFHPLKSL